ncbi:radical SAM protein [Nitratireductor sp. XY-223]|uniref:SPL family radical SAM protein n=1 Tax=Nitratireductor sp. XY-223 TaxID=2561926 RepID=UPI0010A99E7E|nr:radical SAM protein [Nitratireductor sp. XY-223]
MSYKYYLALTSQLPFCSVPLRIDTYSGCQFSCSYCFSKARGGAVSSNTLQEIEPEQLRKRLARVFNGKLSGAVDEFLLRRVPLQLGGMNDPFSPWEAHRKRTLDTLKVLREFQYPTLISTKGNLATKQPYVEVLQSGNFYVRISISVGALDTVRKIEKGVPSLSARIDMAEALSATGIPVSLRFQPVIFGQEEDALRVLKLAGSAGVRHVSAEYLKLPIESRSRQTSYLSAAIPDLVNTYHSLDAKRVGREFVLPTEVKAPGLFFLRDNAVAMGLKFGFAENEFLHLNQFSSCCNAADLFLNNCNFFSGNILGILKRQMTNEKIEFCLPQDEWLPKMSVFSHLNSRSRGKRLVSTKEPTPRTRWKNLLIDKWNSTSGRGGPLSFWGVVSDGRVDSHGNKIYAQSRLLRDTLSSYVVPAEG